MSQVFEWFRSDFSRAESDHFTGKNKQKSPSTKKNLPKTVERANILNCGEDSVIGQTFYSSILFEFKVATAPSNVLWALIPVFPTTMEPTVGVPVFVELKWICETSCSKWRCGCLGPSTSRWLCLLSIKLFSPASEEFEVNRIHLNRQQAFSIY